jgi:hypothetical protein
VPNADFCRDILPKLITDKAKHSPDGAASVELRLYTGGKYMISRIVEAADVALVIDVYSDTRAPRKTAKARTRPWGSAIRL